MIVIGLTGGIASGKSTVSETLAGLGAVVVNADLLGHEVLRPQSDAWQEVVDYFGTGILKGDGEIDRSRLGEIVFNDPEARRRLNQITHPRIHRLVEEQIARLRGEGVKVVVVEAALLVEANWGSLVDQVWVTHSSEAAVIQRLRERNGLSEAQARARIGSQLSAQERGKYAHVIIDTDCPLEETKERVRDLWEALDPH